VSKFQPPEESAAPTVPQSYLNNVHCWRNYVTDLIYAAAQSASAYVREVQKRKPGAGVARAEQAGQAMHNALADQFPGLNCLALARRASGDDATGDQGKRQFYATVARCSAWLPPYPGGVMAQTKERERRSGVTDDQRRANADALVGDL